MKKLLVLLLMVAAMFCACDNSSDSAAATVPPVPAPASTPVIMDIAVECATPSLPLHKDEGAVIKVNISDTDMDAVKAYITVTWNNPVYGIGIPVVVLDEEAAIPAMAAEEVTFEYPVAAYSWLRLGPGNVAGEYTVEVIIEDNTADKSIPSSRDFTVISLIGLM